EDELAVHRGDAVGRADVGGDRHRGVRIGGPARAVPELPVLPGQLSGAGPGQVDRAVLQPVDVGVAAALQQLGAPADPAGGAVGGGDVEHLEVVGVGDDVGADPAEVPRRVAVGLAGLVLEDAELPAVDDAVTVPVPGVAVDLV